jgi:hypothetical protein
MSQVQSEFTDTILTSFDDSPHLHCLATFFAINVSKRIKITESRASYGFDCHQDEMSYENNLMRAVFRQSADDSGPFMEILEFAAAVENVLPISLTCRKWNFILNKNPVTCERIWRRIAQKAYEAQEFEELERIYPEFYFSAWKDLICIKEVSYWKVYNGKMGKMIHRLFWVFLIERIEPYRELYWREREWYDERRNHFECTCTVSPHIEMHTRFGHKLFPTRERGIFRFDVCIDESLIRLKGRFFEVAYWDHTYTVIHFQEECQKIHKWFNVLGLAENDYKIARPIRKRHDKLNGDGTIRVEVVLDNWEYAPHL